MATAVGVLMRNVIVVGSVVLVLVGGLYAAASQRLVGQVAADNSSLGASDAKTVNVTATPDLVDLDYAKKKVLYHQLGVLLADKAKKDATRSDVRELATRLSSEEALSAQQYIDILNEQNEPFMNITDFPETNGCHGYPTSSGMLPYAKVGAYRLSNSSDVDKGFFEIMSEFYKGDKELASIEGARVQYGKLIRLRDASLSDSRVSIERLRALSIGMSP